MVVLSPQSWEPVLPGTAGSLRPPLLPSTPHIPFPLVSAAASGAIFLTATTASPDHVPGAGLASSRLWAPVSGVSQRSQDALSHPGRGHMSLPFRITGGSPNVPSAVSLQEPVRQNVSRLRAFSGECGTGTCQEPARCWLFFLIFQRRRVSHTFWIN